MDANIAANNFAVKLLWYARVDTYKKPIKFLDLIQTKIKIFQMLVRIYQNFQDIASITKWSTKRTELFKKKKHQTFAVQPKLIVKLTRVSTSSKKTA